MNILRRALLLGALLIPFVGAQAADRLPFEASAFEQAQAAGKPIFVHVTAPWCGTCQRQKPIVAKLEQSDEFADLVIFEVDFDTQPEALQMLQVQSQSTMISFKGERETARAVGETDPNKIESLMDKALQ